MGGSDISLSFLGYPASSTVNTAIPFLRISSYFRLRSTLLLNWLKREAQRGRLLLPMMLQGHYRLPRPSRNDLSVQYILPAQYRKSGKIRCDRCFFRPLLMLESFQKNHQGVYATKEEDWTVSKGKK